MPDIIKYAQYYIVYASAGGNAEAIATRIYNETKTIRQSTEGIVANLHCMTLNKFGVGLKKGDIKLNDKTLVVSVISTTGSGDVPDNGMRFGSCVKRLLKKEDPATFNVYTILLGLGDTNYDNFCGAVMKVNKSFDLLKATRLRDIDKADDERGLELVVEPFIKYILTVLCPSQAIPSSPSTPNEISCALKTTSAEDNIPVKTPNKVFKDTYLCACKTKKILTHEKCRKTIVHMEFDMPSDEIRLNQTRNQIQSILNFVPRKKKTLMDYQPGDAIGIRARQPRPVVEKFCKHFQIEYPKKLLIEKNDLCDTKIGWEEALPCSLYDLLTYYIDITSVVPLHICTRLASYCSNGEDASLLKSLSNPENFNRHIKTAHITITDLLRDFSSCNIKMLDLLQLLPAFQPRYFSIACSPKSHPQQIHIAFKKIKFKAYRRQKDITIKGIATHYLGDIKEDEEVSMFLRPTPEFCLPTPCKAPIVMIAPGTGITPFRSFIQHLAHETEPPKCVLFHGCQKQKMDYLYRDEWSMFPFLSMELACSQEPTAGHWYGGQYVQDLMQMEPRADDIVDIMMNQKGRLYVCGDAKSMASSVNRVLHSLLKRKLDISMAKAKEIVQEWIKQSRYQRDVW